MIVKFLLERMSWIVLFFALQLLFMFVTYIDSSIPLQSVLYMIFLSFIVFLIFLMVRYQKETRFYKSLLEKEDGFDISTILEAESPFEKIVETTMVKQTDTLKNQHEQNHLALEQEKDDILAWIHEVKTPLTAMYLIMERIEDERLKADLTYEWLRIHLLLDQQLHQKRIPFIQNDLFIEKLNLEPLIVQEIRTLRTWCVQKGIGFELELEVQTVLTDGKWLSFMIRQILSNAVKYSESGDTILRCYQKEEQTVLEIQDSGKGIDERDLPRIFEKGFTSTKNHQDQAATGMGLFLTMKVAQSLNIQLTVHSEVGVGSTFTLTFPKENQFVQITGM